MFFRRYPLQRLMPAGTGKHSKLRLHHWSFPSPIRPTVHNPEPWAHGAVAYVVHLLLFGSFVTLIALLDGGTELAVGYHALNNLFPIPVANTGVPAVPGPSLFIFPIEKYELFPDVLVEFAACALAALKFSCWYRWFQLGR